MKPAFVAPVQRSLRRSVQQQECYGAPHPRPSLSPMERAEDEVLQKYRKGDNRFFI